LQIALFFVLWIHLMYKYLIWLCLSKTVNCVLILSVFNSLKLSFIIITECNNFAWTLLNIWKSCDSNNDETLQKNKEMRIRILGVCYQMPCEKKMLNVINLSTPSSLLLPSNTLQIPLKLWSILQLCKSICIIKI